MNCFFLFTQGNHEEACVEQNPKACPVGQRNFITYLERWHMPYRQSGGPNNMYFSWDFANVHFISMDSEVTYPGSPEGPVSSNRIDFQLGVDCENIVDFILNFLFVFIGNSCEC